MAKIRDIMKGLSKLDPDMDMNDLRECLTTNKDEVDKLVQSLDEDTDSWDEFSAKLTKVAIIPMLLEIRDLMLMPSSGRGWLKPTEMAKKVAEQAAINKSEYQKRIAELEASFGEAKATSENEHAARVAELGTAQDDQIAAMRREHDTAVEEIEEIHDRRLTSLMEDHGHELKRLHDRIDELVQANSDATDNTTKAMRAVPGRQAEAVAEVLTDAADRVEAMAQMRLARLVKRKSLFRDKDLDQTMLRVEADGIMVSAKRLRQMAAEAVEQGVWPIEFADGEEDTPEAKEALARMLTPIQTETVAAKTEVEVEAD